MATKVDLDAVNSMDLSLRERGMLQAALSMALASKKRALNAPTSSDEMKLVYQREMAELTALYMRMLGQK